jgi:N-acetylmuramoyl-L-alanine amidase
MMRKFSKCVIWTTIMSLAFFGWPMSQTQTVSAFSNQVIQQGAVGDDVIELQSRLQYLGFYNGKIDGVFGWGTYWALRNFQYEFGLPIDGLAGSTTKTKLIRASKYHKDYVKDQINKGNKFTHYGGVPIDQQTKQNNNNQPAKQVTPAKNANQAPKATQTNKAKPAPKTGQNTPAQKPSAANVPSGFSQNDIQLMANAVYGEARGEPYTGQVAVAAVILNRIQSASFPDTVSGVIFEPRAFTAVADGQIWLTPNETAKKAVLDAMNGWDPTGNALYYFNPDTATSGWIWGRPQIKKIGKHIFCK